MNTIGKIAVGLLAYRVVTGRCLCRDLMSRPAIRVCDFDVVPSEYGELELVTVTLSDGRHGMMPVAEQTARLADAGIEPNQQTLTDALNDDFAAAYGQDRASGLAELTAPDSAFVSLPGCMTVADAMAWLAQEGAAIGATRAPSGRQSATIWWTQAPRNAMLSPYGPVR